MGFLFLKVLILLGMPINAVLVFSLGYGFLSKSILGHGGA